MPEYGRRPPSRIAFGRPRKHAALDLRVVSIQRVGEHRIAVQVLSDEARRTFAADAPEVLQHEDLSSGAGSGPDPDGWNRQLRRDSRGQIRRNAFENH